MENPYNLPEEFSFIINKLNKLSILLSNKVITKVTKVIRSAVKYQEATLVITKDIDYLLLNTGAPGGISGCILNRFNSTIYTYITLLQLAYPKNKEIPAFSKWIIDHIKKQYEESKILELKEQASKIGFILTPKPSVNL